MDLGETFTASQAYVMLSRIEDINQLVIMDRIKEKSIRINPEALTYILKVDKLAESVFLLPKIGGKSA